MVFSGYFRIIFGHSRIISGHSRIIFGPLRVIPGPFRPFLRVLLVRDAAAAPCGCAPSSCSLLPSLTIQQNHPVLHILYIILPLSSFWFEVLSEEMRNLQEAENSVWVTSPQSSEQEKPRDLEPFPAQLGFAPAPLHSQLLQEFHA